MRRTNLTELAGNPNFISGIYNYCDRWCERCPLTSRCLVYAQEKEDEDDSPESRDIGNEAFWRRLASVLEETQQLITECSMGAVSDVAVTAENLTVRRKRRDRSAQNPLAVAGKEYASAVSQWFTDLDQTVTASDAEVNESDVEEVQQLQDAREVIHWYQYQIAVKTMRALSSRDDDRETPDDILVDALVKDSDGSAKVALIGIDRSISAWRWMQLSLPERADLIVPMILRLKQLRYCTETEFPNARDFIRPGFDEILGEAN